MRALWLGTALILLAGGCTASLTSEHPLIAAGPEQPRGGLWALIEPGCTTPATAAVQSWPSCATPVWLKPGEATIILSAPTRMGFVLSGGEPRIAQVRVPAQASEPNPEYGYYAVIPEGAAPFTRARVWEVACPEDSTDKPCTVATEADLRRAARASPRQVLQAAWIASAE